jgi:hypothetical protein
VNGCRLEARRSSEGPQSWGIYLYYSKRGYGQLCEKKEGKDKETDEGREINLVVNFLFVVWKRMEFPTVASWQEKINKFEFVPGSTPLSSIYAPIIASVSSLLLSPYLTLTLPHPQKIHSTK